MTREELRGELKRISCRWCEQNSYCMKSCGIPESDLKRLSGLGVVLQVDIAKPPIVFSEKFEIDSKLLAMIIERVRNAYDGYVAVEPLIDTVRMYQENTPVEG